MSEKIFSEAKFDNAAEHLRRAKEAIETLGWEQGSYLGYETGGVCALGALRAASFGVYKNGDYHHKDVIYPSEWAPIYEAEQILEEAFTSNLTSRQFNIAQWNDKEGRKLQDVLKLYDKAIAIAEARNG